MANSYQVFVDDNFHYMDEDERYKLGNFETFEEAVKACKLIVDECLNDGLKKGITAKELYSIYTGFGDEPFIVGEPVPYRFSARDYAKERCKQLCKEV